MLFTLRPLLLESRGLVAALGQLADKMEDTHGKRVELYTDPNVTRGMDLSRQAVIFFIAITRQEEADIGMLFRGFSSYGRAVGANFLRSLIVSLCGLLFLLPCIIAVVVIMVVLQTQDFAAIQKPELLIIPVLLFLPAIVGVFVVTLMLQMTFYVIADDPTVGIWECLKRS